MKILKKKKKLNAYGRGESLHRRIKGAGRCCLCDREIHLQRSGWERGTLPGGKEALEVHVKYATHSQ